MGRSQTSNYNVDMVLPIIDLIDYLLTWHTVAICEGIPFYEMMKNRHTVDISSTYHLPKSQEWPLTLICRANIILVQIYKFVAKNPIFGRNIPW